MCSEFPAEVKDKKGEKIDEDFVESGEVISVCEFQWCYTWIQHDSQIKLF